MLAEDLIKLKAESGVFEKSGIYIGMLNKTSISAYIGMSIGNYMAFIIFGYIEVNPIYLTYLNGKWTKTTL